MAHVTPRVGPADTPTTTVTGIVGTSAEVRQFQKSNEGLLYARPCLVVNKHASVSLFVIVNATGATDTNFMFEVGPSATVDVSVEGTVNVVSVSLYYAATATFADALVFGWTP